MTSLAFCVAAPFHAQHRSAARCTRRKAPRVVCSVSPSISQKLVTMNDVVRVAEGQGYRIEKYAAGPVCKLDIHRGDELYAFITAVIMPTGWLHIESYKAKKKEEGGLLSVTPGMFVFIFALAFGASRGCKEIYGLAIRDDKRQHQRLLRYLKRFGGVEVRKVTESIHSIPDRLLYGGNGMIVKGDLQSMLQRAGRMLQRVKRKPDSEVGFTVERWPEGMPRPSTDE